MKSRNGQDMSDPMLLIGLPVIVFKQGPVSRDHRCHDPGLRLIK